MSRLASDETFFGEASPAADLGGTDTSQRSGDDRSRDGGEDNGTKSESVPSLKSPDEWLVENIQRDIQQQPAVGARADDDNSRGSSDVDAKPVVSPSEPPAIENEKSLPAPRYDGHGEGRPVQDLGVAQGHTAAPPPQAMTSFPAEPSRGGEPDSNHRRSELSSADDIAQGSQDQDDRLSSGRTTNRFGFGFAPRRRHLPVSTPGAFAVPGASGIDRNDRSPDHANLPDTEQLSLSPEELAALGISNGVPDVLSPIPGWVAGSANTAAREGQDTTTMTASVAPVRYDERTYEGVAIQDRNREREGQDLARPSFLRRHMNKALIIACLAVVGIAVTLGLVLKPSSDMESQRYSAIKSILGSQSDIETLAPALQDSSSPQHRALRWIADQDPRQVDWQDEEALVQRFAVVTIFFATGGEDSWVDMCNFLSGESECEWKAEYDQVLKGVRCRSDNVTVDTVVIPENNMTGSLPDEVGLLRGLDFIGLWSNKLSGPIPSYLGRLDRIYYLGLQKNHLSSAIPSSLGNLSALKTLSLHSNNLTGAIPLSLGNLTSLENLYLYVNNLSGHIPPHIGRLSSLQELELQYNQLTGIIPSSLGNLRGVEFLGLQSNKLSGPIPSYLGRLDHMYYLGLQENHLSSAIPSSLGNLSALKTLSLHSNDLTGAIPSSLGNLTSLENLYLYVNNLSGHIPPHIRRLSSLRELWLQYNQLTGTIPAEVNDLTKLESLRLKSNALNGTLPFIAGSLPNLQRLLVQENAISGSIPGSIFSYRNLTTFHLANNFLTGTLPPEVGNLTHLEVLRLFGNSLSGTIPLSLTSLNRLNIFNIGDNSFWGTVPWAIGKLSNLRLFSPNENRFTGTLPESIGNLTGLEALWLRGNQFSGTIPRNVIQLEFLDTLAIHNNSFTGDVDFLCVDHSFKLLMADCHVDNPEVSCKCCNACCSDKLGLTGPVFGCFPNSN